jgi:hypothetical protein
MEIRTLYRYTRADGGVTVSPNKPECEYTEMYRLIADEGKALTDGEIITPCIDVDSTDGWSEIDAPEDDGPEENATEDDYINALAELGVSNEENDA